MRLLPLATLLLVGCGGTTGYEISRVFGSSQDQVRAAERHPEVAALPVIGRVGGGQTELVLRGRMSAQRARKVMAMARATYHDVTRRFIGTSARDDRPPVDVCVFFSGREYDRFVRRLYGATHLPRFGFYLDGERILVINLSRDIGNLRHELVHPLLRDDFPGVPDWLNEGLASLYETARYRNGRYQFVVNGRLRHLWSALRARDLPTLEQLAASGYEDVHGRGWRTWYATGCHLLLYMERAGRLERFYRAVRAHQVDADGQLALLRRHVDYASFVTWTTRIRVGMVIGPPRARRR
jgi:hypothetical protein